MDRLGEEGISREKPFRISDYRDGIFQPNGQFSGDSIFSPKAITAWEQYNQNELAGKGWSIGQALFFKDRPLVLGRSPSDTNVVIDRDLSPNGEISSNRTVSRRHFELQPPDDNGIIITDLKSHNGTHFYSREINTVKVLNASEPTATLKEGDFVIFGVQDSVNPNSAVIGLRVCKDANGKIFLVKFNAQDTEDLDAMLPRSVSNSKEPEKDKEELTKAMEGAAKLLIIDMQELNKEVAGSPKRLERYQRLFNDLFEMSRDYGDTFFDGNWREAAGLMAKKLIEAGERFLKEGDPRKADLAGKVANLCLSLAEENLLEE